MGKSEQMGPHKSSPVFANGHKHEKRKRPFAKFRKTVDRELERTILDHMRVFRDEIIKLRERK